MGYLSEWANNQFTDVSAKNEFYASFGENLSPRGDEQLRDSLDSEMGPKEVIDLMTKVMAA